MAKTVWDSIYKDYKKGGKAYATLGADMEGPFIKFIESTSLPRKHALDIGFGNGRYVKLLREHGYSVEGIDNSPTALDLASKNIGTKEGLIVADMYKYTIPADTYDLIYSISTIHHGAKEKVNKLLEDIYLSLIPGGYVYFTIPILSSSNAWMSFKDKKEVAPGTFEPTSGREKGLPHSFYKRPEVEALFSKYKSLTLDEDDRGRWIILAQK